MDASAFPCAVRILAVGDEPEYTLRTVYLQANERGAWVWAWSPTAQQVYAAVEGAEVVGSRDTGWTVHDSEGAQLAAVTYTSGDCACSHPMKGWRPPGASRVSTEPVGQWGGPATSG